MTNQFTVLNTALRSLQSQQKALDTIGHNISNANTEGYSRQRAELVTTSPYTKPARNQPAGAGQIGTGVEVADINRIRDEFVDGQIRTQNQRGGYWNEISQGLEQIERIFNEPSENNISQAMVEFRDSLQELSNNPSDSAARTAVRGRAESLAETFRETRRQLGEYQGALNDEIRAGKDEVNTLLSRIASLNQEIIQVKGSGQSPNDLMDTRDKYIDELSELINISASEDERGSVNISIGGTNMVSGNSYNELEVVPDEDLDDMYRLQHAHTGQEVNVREGKLQGRIELRNEILGGLEEKEEIGYIDKLDEIAGVLMENFNEIHESGFDLEGEKAGEFFTGLEMDEPARHMAVADNINESVDNIAAGNLSTNPHAARILTDPQEIDFEGYAYEVEVGEFGEESMDFSLIEIDEDDETTSYDFEVEYDGEDEEIEFRLMDDDEVEDDVTFRVEFDPDVEEIEVDWGNNNNGSITFPGSEDDYTDEEIYRGLVENLDTGVINNVFDEVDIASEFEFGLFNEGDAQFTDQAAPGNSSNASALARTIDEYNYDIFDDNTTVQDYFEGMVSELGVEGQQANNMVENSEAISEQLENRREQTSGVSMDEEMAKMIQHQQAYAAAANVITTAQQNLDTLIGMVR